MSPALKYSLGRIGLFLICAIPAFLLFPDVNVFFRLLVALVVSAGLSFFLLRQWRDEVAEQMSTNARRRISEKEQLRSALAGEDDSSPADRPDRPDEDQPPSPTDK